MSRFDKEKHLEELVSQTQVSVRAYIAGLGVPLDEIDDLAQEVYIAYFQGMDRVPEDIETLKWLKGISRNLCLKYFTNYRRRGDRHMQLIAEQLSKLEEPPAEMAEAVQGRLQHCLGKLSSKNRQLVSLHYEEDQSAESIGQILEMNASAVWTALSRVRVFLKKCVQNANAKEGLSS